MEAFATVHERMHGTCQIPPRADLAFLSRGVKPTLSRDSFLMRAPDAVENGRDGRWRRPSLLNKSSAARCSPCPCPHNIRRPPPTPCALLSAATLLHCGCSQFAGRCAYSCMGKRQLRWLLKWCIRHAGVPKLAGEEPAIFFFQPVREPSPSSSCTHPLAY